MPPNGMDPSSNSSMELAKRDLRETDEIRSHALIHMRKWLSRNRHVSNVRTDDAFLLRFLRVTKFSLPMAEQVLLKWLNLRKTFPVMFKNLGCHDARLRQLMDGGYILVSPRRDTSGRRVIFYDVKKFDPTKYTSEDMARAHILTYETLLEDDEVQVRGVVHVADLRGLTSAHVSCWSPDIFIRLVRWGEQSMPLRHKEIHLLNVPTAIRYVFEMIKTLVSKKINKRIMLHNSLSSLCSMVDSSCLPSEYGGTMSSEEIISRWKKELEHNSNAVRSLDKMDILNTTDIQTSKKIIDLNNNVKEHFTGVSGSFRKLEID